ncbi:MAG: 30S ribosomal protein S28e [Candidatus Aenigmarchaeota archaeon]|nr:30S ribosomal protein S28e [Candidatus Aenigmarchaeota archaeon]
MPIPAKVIALMGKTGAKGVSRVRCKILDDFNRDKVIVRNVMGPVKLGDILMIHKADMETADAIN